MGIFSSDRTSSETRNEQTSTTQGLNTDTGSVSLSNADITVGKKGALTQNYEIVASDHGAIDKGLALAEGATDMVYATTQDALLFGGDVVNNYTDVIDAGYQFSDTVITDTTEFLEDNLINSLDYSADLTGRVLDDNRDMVDAVLVSNADATTQGLEFAGDATTLAFDEISTAYGTAFDFAGDASARAAESALVSSRDGFRFAGEATSALLDYNKDQSALWSDMVGSSFDWANNAVGQMGTQAENSIQMIEDTARQNANNLSSATQQVLASANPDNTILTKLIWLLGAVGVAWSLNR